VTPLDHCRRIPFRLDRNCTVGSSAGGNFGFVAGFNIDRVQVRHSALRIPRLEQCHRTPQHRNRSAGSGGATRSTPFPAATPDTVQLSWELHRRVHTSDTSEFDISVGVNSESRVELSVAITPALDSGPAKTGTTESVPTRRQLHRPNPRRRRQ